MEKATESPSCLSWGQPLREARQLEDSVAFPFRPLRFLWGRKSTNYLLLNRSTENPVHQQGQHTSSPRTKAEMYVWFQCALTTRNAFFSSSPNPVLPSGSGSISHSLHEAFMTTDRLDMTTDRSEASPKVPRL